MGMKEFECDRCGATLTYDMMTLDEHDIPRWCPECENDARKSWVKTCHPYYTGDAGKERAPKHLVNDLDLDYSKYADNLRNEHDGHDAVNHPGHYTFGDIEVIDYIRDKLTPEEFQGYCCGNILKYVSRHKHKNGAEDLKKAQVYLGWLIESEEGAK